MRDITISFGADIDQNDLNNLRSTLKYMGHGDKITIQIEAADAHEAGRITDELARQGFDYQPHGGHGNEFYFTAYKKTE